MPPPIAQHSVPSQPVDSMPAARSVVKVTAHRRALAAIALAAGLVLAGCGRPATISSGAPAPVTATGSHGAPPLTQPELDTTPYVPDPCKLFTGAQLAALGVPANGELSDGGLGKSCRWYGDDQPSKINFSVDINTQLGGLDQLYARKETFSLWKPIEIAGYPAVINDEDTQATGHCRLNVAVARTVLVATDVQLQHGVDKPADYTDPCPRGIKILEQVVATLKGGK